MLQADILPIQNVTYCTTTQVLNYFKKEKSKNLAIIIINAFKNGYIQDKEIYYFMEMQNHPHENKNIARSIKYTVVKLLEIFNVKTRTELLRCLIKAKFCRI
jgi:hypothetical protein